MTDENNGMVVTEEKPKCSEHNLSQFPKKNFFFSTTAESYVHPPSATGFDLTEHWPS